MRLYVFGAEWCVGCKQIKKAKVVEKFEEKYPDVKVLEVNADSKKGARLLDAWKMDGIPAFVFTEDDFDDKSIGGEEGDDSDDSEEVSDMEVVLHADMGTSLSDLEKFYTRAKKEEAKRA